MIEEVTTTDYEEVVHPAHYNAGSIEVWDLWVEYCLDPFIANAVKYICRAGKKPGVPIESDLKKAIQYIEKRITSGTKMGNYPNYLCTYVDAEFIEKFAQEQKLNLKLETTLHCLVISRNYTYASNLIKEAIGLAKLEETQKEENKR